MLMSYVYITSALYIIYYIFFEHSSFWSQLVLTELLKVNSVIWLGCVMWFYKSCLHSLHLFCVCVFMRVCLRVCSSSCRLMQHYRAHTSLSTLLCSLLQWRLVEAYVTLRSLKYPKVCFSHMAMFFFFYFDSHFQENSSQPQVESSGDHSPYAYQQTKWWRGTTYSVTVWWI